MATYPSLSLYGSHIGGLLAATVALRASGNPLTSSLRTIGGLGLSRRIKKRTAPIVQLHDGRPKHPHRGPFLSPPAGLASVRRVSSPPETSFDAFASPILFLHTPGAGCPSENPDPSLNFSPAAPAFEFYDDDDVQPNSSTTSYQALSVGGAFVGTEMYSKHASKSQGRTPS